MAKTETNLKASEDFIRDVLSKNFQQTVKNDQLRAAAERLCEVMPERAREAA